MSVPSKPRLLAVDDSRLILRVIRDYFAAQGWEVVEADDGAAGAAALSDGLPTAIVSDVLMPGMDGWDFYRAVRGRAGGADVPFVFLTVERELPSRLQGLHIGADDYMTKPFDVEELYARITRLVDKRAEREAMRSRSTALLAGSVEHMAISDLLQIWSLNGKEGTVHLRQDGSDGRIEFEAGQMVDAACGTVRGVKALFRMLGWDRAEFHVTPRRDPLAERTIDIPASAVLMDGLVSLDDWVRWKEHLPAPEASVDLAPDARARLQGHTPNAVEFDVLSRAKNRTPVGRILDENPFPDALVAEALCTLAARGVIRVHAPEGAPAAGDAAR